MTKIQLIAVLLVALLGQIELCISHTADEKNDTPRHLLRRNSLSGRESARSSATSALPEDDNEEPVTISSTPEKAARFVQNFLRKGGKSTKNLLPKAGKADKAGKAIKGEKQSKKSKNGTPPPVIPTPSSSPSSSPVGAPSSSPVGAPSSSPSSLPSFSPTTAAPSVVPSSLPSSSPTLSAAPTSSPSSVPSSSPTVSAAPSPVSSSAPSSSPTSTTTSTTTSSSSSSSSSSSTSSDANGAKAEEWVFGGRLLPHPHSNHNNLPTPAPITNPITTPEVDVAAAVTTASITDPVTTSEVEDADALTPEVRTTSSHQDQDEIGWLADFEW